MLRSVLEQATHGLVFRRRLPSRFGGCTFYASPEGGLRYLRRDVYKIDPPLLEAALDMVGKGDVVWDIGANVGLFSFASAGLAGPEGRVFSVEPDTVLVRLLRRSAALRNPNAARVDVLPLAVADSLALQRFQIATRARSSNFLEGHGATQTGGVRETQTVMTVTLDWLETQLPPPSVLKIDAEGAEVRILDAGRNVLRKYQPRLLCEVAGENADEVSRILRECGYEIFDAEQPRNARQPIASAPWATMALPAGRPATLSL
jgi:FkbM family methyltransferase